MTHTPQSLDEIVAAQRYIHAKLRKFELDQVTQPFAQSAQQQGLARAVRGALQRAALKATTFYDHYVARVASQIEGERQLVAAFEREHGESFARDVYHRIRDAPEEDIPTYKVSRAVFRKLERDLERERAKRSQNPITKAWRHAKAWVTYGDRELKAAAIAAGVLIGATVMVPVHRINEWKDHHRPVHYTQYQFDAIDPMTHAAIATRNFAMHLHDTWNRTGGSISARYVAQEWDEFIKPGANPSQLEHMADMGGNDWTKPYGTALQTSLAQAKERIAPVARPLSQVNAGERSRLAAWDYDKDEDGHYETETYDCGTSERPQTCTRLVYVCDKITYTWDLNHRAFSAALQTLLGGRADLPVLPAAQPDAWTLTIKDLAKEDRNITTAGTEAIQERLDFVNGWRRSPFLTQYASLLQGIHAMRTGSLAEQMVSDAKSYPAHFVTVNRSCGSAREHPRGWAEHQRLSTMVAAINNPYAALGDALSKTDTVLPATEKAMSVLRDSRDEDATQDALRDLGDLAYRIENLHETGNGWHPSHAMRLFLEWLGFLGTGALAGFGGYALLDKYRDSRLVRKLHDHDIEPELVDPWRRNGRRY